MFNLGIEMAEQAYPALMAEANHIALSEFLGRLDQCLPARAIEALDQRRLDLRLGFPADAAATQLGRYHPGIVHHQLIAGLKPVRKIGHDAVTQNAVGLHDQHPRAIARARRAQRDVACGKLEVEEVGAHACPRRDHLREAPERLA